MDLKHFGDAYDIVKKNLLQWLAPFGPWAVHPMFTHKVSKPEAKRFSQFLGVPLLSTNILKLDTKRKEYLEPCGRCRSIFLDPDTGVRLHRRERHRATEFIFEDELLTIVRARPSGLVMVFDQSVPRGREAKQAQSKLDHFAAHGVVGFAYVSQACILVLSQSPQIADEARSQVLRASGLPDVRILPTTPASIAPRPTSAGPIRREECISD
ncbi:MAG: hypothetical protein AB1806_13960 [Acidobacteriota bacterium]